MKSLTLFVIAIISIWLTACSSLSVNYDYNQKTDFSQYQTYDWLPTPANIKVDELNHQRFVTAVENHLAAKNITRDTAKPDFLIATHFGKETKVDITNWGYAYAPSTLYSGHGYRYSDRYNYTTGHVAGGGISTYEYELGTLILDFVDAGSKQLIWRATAKGIISPSSTPEKQTEKINRAVDEILASFPPQQH